MPKTIRETLKQEAEIYRGALGLINRIMEEDKNMDPDVLSCFKKMKTVSEEIDYLEQRSKRENIPDYELQRELSTFKIAGSLKFGLEDETAAKLDEYFFNMDPSIVKTEEGKNLVQVYLKSSAVESRKVTAWSLEKIELDRRFSSLLEKTPLEELRNIDNMIADTQNKVNELAEKLKNNLEYQIYMKAEKSYQENVSEENKRLQTLEAFDKEIAENKVYLDDITGRCNAIKDIVHVYFGAAYEERFNETLKSAERGNEDAQEALFEKLDLYNEMVHEVRKVLPEDLQEEVPYALSWKDMKTTGFMKGAPRANQWKYEMKANRLETDRSQLQKRLLTQGDLKDEKVYKDLLKETQHLKDLKEAKTTLNEIGKSTRALKSLIRGEDAKSIIEDNIMEDAQRLFEMDGMHKGSHNNSKEFDHMMNMMKMVMNWNDPDQSAYMDMLRENGVNVPETMSEALDAVKASAEAYKTAKLEQHRPFPSPRRQFRLGLVDVILEFVDRHKAELDMGSVEKVEELKISNKPEVNVQVNAPENEPKIPELNVPIFQ